MKFLDFIETKKLWYLAHPYIKNPKYNFMDANVISADLIKRGYIVFSPVSMSHPIDAYSDEFPQEFWYKFDFVIANRCDGIILSGDWKSSTGCLLEKKFFENKGLPVLEYKTIVRESLNLPIDI